EKSQAREIRTFAQKMVDDHDKANAALAALAKRLKLQVAPPTAEQRAQLTELRKKSGADFDAAWTDQMVKDHDEAVSLFSAAGTLDDAQLATFARDTLPVLTRHQEMANQLATRH